MSEIELTRKQIEEKLGDWRWRMNNLYSVIDEDAKQATFSMRWAQQEVFERMWYRNIILKSRQIGITTFKMIFMLDQAVFNDNTKCGVIAHGLDEASDLFENKIIYAYEKLPKWLQRIRSRRRSSGKRILLSNDSSIRVGTSMRSGTLRYLHVSEFGKICRKYPERAKEIVTGSFPAVPADSVITIESTAEGQHGYFYDYCQEARTRQESLKKLTNLDFRFFFFAWWRDPKYKLSAEDTAITIIPARLAEYFIDLENDWGIELTPEQQAWYVKTEAVLGSEMKREHPSTPDEAFEQAIEGAYFAKEMQAAHAEGRIGDFPYQPGVPVDTWWDLGMFDETVIWFSQTVGGRIHMIDFYENSGEGIQHYLKLCQSKGYSYRQHYGPHDLEVREMFSDGRSRVDKARSMGFKFEVVPRVPSKQDAIDAARDALPICTFDEAKCSEGIKKLERYRKKWDDRYGRWKEKPLHDSASNTADAFMTMATGHPMFKKGVGRSRVITTVRNGRLI